MNTEIGNDKLFTENEVDLVQSTWKSMVTDGTSEAGLALLYRFFVEVPEVKSLFYQTAIDNLPENFTKEDLRQRKKFYNHAKRVGTTLDVLVTNMDSKEKFVRKCITLGVAHKKHNVELHHFDALGDVLLGIVERVLEIDSSHPTSKAWRKAYVTIADYIKRGLRS